jgi:hypothetical protein
MEWTKGHDFLHTSSLATQQLHNFKQNVESSAPDNTGKTRHTGGVSSV